MGLCTQGLSRAHPPVQPCSAITSQLMPGNSPSHPFWWPSQWLVPSGHQPPRPGEAVPAPLVACLRAIPLQGKLSDESLPLVVSVRIASAAVRVDRSYLSLSGNRILHSTWERVFWGTRYSLRGPQGKQGLASSAPNKICLY